MRRLLVYVAAFSLLTGCAGMGALTPLPPPSQFADQTTVDERAALGVETLYQGWRSLVTTGVELGLVRGELAGRLQDYDRRIYAAVTTARRAYDAGNARSYAEATAQASALIAEASALIRGDD